MKNIEEAKDKHETFKREREAEKQSLDQEI